MKAVCSLVIGIGFFCGKMLAQEWEWLYPNPTAHDLYDVQMVTPDEG